MVASNLYGSAWTGASNVMGNIGNSIDEAGGLWEAGKSIYDKYF